MPKETMKILLGIYVEINGDQYKVNGIETFATEEFGDMIGIITQPKDKEI